MSRPAPAPSAGSTMASSPSLLPLLLLFLLFSAIGATRVNRWDPAVQLSAGDAKNGTTWAVLVAGSKGYGNYRHQADVCHAYQVLKKGGLKDENIIVFMSDDIARNEWNPTPGIIINHPNGTDVYAGVPKDYTGDNAIAANLYAVLLGDKKAVKGRGSGKVVDSKPNDRIFLYYSDHGGAGVLGMPIVPFVYANDLIKTLKKKHASKGYKEMLIYIEACESGSIFEGLLPEDIDVYVTTASGPTENSFATYCPETYTPEGTCLGDVYSVAWMEDSESHNLKKETVKQQYLRVKDRTSKPTVDTNGSHVMEYGHKSISKEKLFLYQGFDPASANYPPNNIQPHTPFRVVNQRDADLVSLWHKYKTLEHGSEAKNQLLKEVREITARRAHLDKSVKLIGQILYGPERGSLVLDSVRAPGLPLVDDWGCLKTTVRTFEKHCGSLTQYGMKHMRAFANICNSGVSEAVMEEAAMTACIGYDPGEWHPSIKGYSA